MCVLTTYMSIAHHVVIACLGNKPAYSHIETKHICYGKYMKAVCLAQVLGQVVCFLRFCVVFRVSRSRSLQDSSATCLNASVLFARRICILKFVKLLEIL